jgi:hypothetical protein
MPKSAIQATKQSLSHRRPLQNNRTNADIDRIFNQP